MVFRCIIRDLASVGYRIEILASNLFLCELCACKEKGAGCVFVLPCLNDAKWFELLEFTEISPTISCTTSVSTFPFGYAVRGNSLPSGGVSTSCI
jgi:hypothetical protein